MFTCDRCGERTDNPPLLHTLLFGQGGERHVRLCEECRKSFLAWWKEGEER